MIASEAVLSVVGRLRQISPLIPYYHVVCDDRLAHIRHLHPYKSRRQFRDDIDLICRRYKPLFLEDLLGYARQAKSLRRKGFILTFDDGYSQIASIIAPLLYQKGLPAIFFLTSNSIDNQSLNYRNKASLLVERLSEEGPAAGLERSGLARTLGVPGDQLIQRILAIGYHEAGLLDDLAARIGLDFAEFLRTERPYLTSPEIERLIDLGFIVGAHGLNHPPFRDICLEDQVYQTTESLRIIRSRFGLRYSFFAFPHSDMFVKREFFDRVKSAVDLSFGTCGIRRDPISTNLQRINFERPPRPAGEILVRQTIKKIVVGRFPRTNIVRVL